jgi:hypothetical protein
VPEEKHNHPGRYCRQVVNLSHEIQKPLSLLVSLATDTHFSSTVSDDMNTGLDNSMFFFEMGKLASASNHMAFI